MLDRAVALATNNAERGQLPFGALVVRDGAVLAEGVNTALADLDPTAHAEVVAIRRACAALRTLDLSGAFVVSSCEPCALCLASAAAVGITEIAYAAPKELVPDLGYPGPDGSVSGLLDNAARAANPAGLRHVETPGAATPFDRYLAVTGQADQP
jgi:tRNA(Arg) A34 adenosine deaminase TadA